jgi:hypothetical protein
MTRPNPWGENWHNENYSSAEMDQLFDQIFGPKCTFMGFLPAGKRKWVKKRTDGVMEVIKLHSARGYMYYGFFGLSFPWIPHGNWKQVCWHKTPKSAEVDLRYQPPNERDWAIPKGRTVAAERATLVSTEICEKCEPWFAKMKDQRNILAELEQKRLSRDFYSFVQDLTVYCFWQARIGKWNGFEEKIETQLKSYFGQNGFPELKQLLEQETLRSKPQSEI